MGKCCNCTTDVKIDAFFSSNLCLTIFCHITVVICHFIVDNISGNLFKCKNKPSEMALISVSSHFKVIFESVSFHCHLCDKLIVLHSGVLQSKN